MGEFAPNLYSYFGFDPATDSTVLGLELAERAHQLEQAGIGPDSPQHQQLHIAYGVLSNLSNRAIYDETIKTRQVAWHELGHLANFGRWPIYGQSHPYQSSVGTPPSPAASTPPTVNQTYQQYRYGETVQAPQTPQQIPHAPQAAQLGGYQQAMPPQGMSQQGAYPPTNVYGVGAVPAMMQSGMRATRGTRAGIAILDLLILLIVTSPVSFIFESEVILASVLQSLFAAAYYVGFEVKLGATPAKLLGGYTVRDVNTHSKLSFEQSVKRNWWRLVSIVPGLGGIVSFIAAIVLFTTISEENQLRGAQDRFGDAEVVRKSQSG